MDLEREVEVGLHHSGLELYLRFSERFGTERLTKNYTSMGTEYQSSTTLGLDAVSSGPPRTKKLH